MNHSEYILFAVGSLFVVIDPLALVVFLILPA